MLRKLFKDTIIYGIATVLPRVLTLLLTRLYVNKLDTADFGIYSGLFVYLILGNVLLSYGMETAFFRFMNKGEQKKKVQSTALTSLTISSLFFLLIAYLLRHFIASWLNYDMQYIVFAIYILVLDALVVIPFAWLRNKGKAKLYAMVKIGNTALNLALNIYYLNYLSAENLATNGGVYYIFLANVIASLATFIVLLPIYLKIRFKFYYPLWIEMMIYAFPVLLAGIAFAVNEGFDRVFLRMLLPVDTADGTIGIYSACYKMGVFMNLFVTAYKLGIEPFFFSSSQDKNAPKTYARITEYFIVCGGFILLFITVFTDVFKLILITVVFNFALIPWLSYKGAALATLITYAAMMSISYYYGQKYYPIPYKKRKIKIFLGMSVLFSFINFYAFGNSIYIGILFLLIYGYLASFAIKLKALRSKA